MVSRHQQVSQITFSRGLRRSIQSLMKGTMVFKRSRNSIYDERDYFAVFMEATQHNNKVMMHGASRSLNLRATRRDMAPKYSKRRRAKGSGKHETKRPYQGRYYPAGNTILKHIKDEFEIHNGTLQTNILSRKHVNSIQKKIEQIVSKAVRSGAIKPENATTGITVAFDYSDQDYWGLPNGEVVRTRAEGTTNAYRYAMPRIVSSKAEYCLPPLSVNSDSRTHYDLEMILQQIERLAIPVQTMLLDRAFYNIYCINLLESRKLRYLMPAKTGNMKREMQQRIRKSPKDHVSIYRYRLGNEPKHSSSTFIVVVPPDFQHPSQRNRNKRPRSIAFATNIQLRQNATQTETNMFGRELSRIYRLRFGIETDWSILKTLRPKTTSSSAVIRLFYFYFSVLLYDAWVHARRIQDSLIRLDFLILYVLVTSTREDRTRSTLQLLDQG